MILILMLGILTFLGVVSINLYWKKNAYVGVGRTEYFLNYFTDMYKAVTYINKIGGGVIHFDAGTYFPTKPLVIGNNVEFRGAGWGYPRLMR